MVLLKWNHSVSLSILESSYKVREQSLLPSTSHHRMRSTQSDTALLPTNVYFQRTLSPVSVPSKTGSRAGRRRGSKVRSFRMHLCCLFVHFKEHLLFFQLIVKFFTVFQEEEMTRTLDQAIEVARSMKRTTDKMAKRLSADLAKAKLHRKLHSMQPLEGRKHHAL